MRSSPASIQIGPCIFVLIDGDSTSVLRKPDLYLPHMFSVLRIISPINDEERIVCNADYSVARFTPTGPRHGLESELFEQIGKYKV